MKVLITGSSGFVATNLVPYLENKGHDIIAVARIKNNQGTRRCIQYEELASLLAEEPPVEAIVHLAGKAHDLRNVSDPMAYYEVNTELTKRLFENFLNSGASTFIYISSVKAAADRVDGVLTEDVVAQPETEYGKSKLAAERYLLSKVLPEGKKVFILRPCMIHGPGNKGNLNLLYKLIRSGIPYPLATFDNRRSFLSIGNLVFVIGEILTRSDIPSGVYNVADTHPLSTNTVIRLIGESLGKKTFMLRLPKSLVQALAKPGDVLSFLPFNTDRLKKLTNDYVVSNAKIIAALKKPLPVDSEQGMKTTFQSFRK